MGGHFAFAWSPPDGALDRLCCPVKGSPAFSLPLARLPQSRVEESGEDVHGQ